MRSGVEHGPINPIKNVAEGFYLVWKPFFFFFSWFPVILEGYHEKKEKIKGVFESKHLKENMSILVLCVCKCIYIIQF